VSSHFRVSLFAFQALVKNLSKKRPHAVDCGLLKMNDSSRDDNRLLVSASEIAALFPLFCLIVNLLNVGLKTLET